ncbi:hypothetical protein E0K69_24170, partial [Escherichia coli]
KSRQRWLFYAYDRLRKTVEEGCQESPIYMRPIFSPIS